MRRKAESEPQHNAPPNMHRGGATYNPDRDFARLGRQQQDVWRVMRRGGLYTLRDIEAFTGHPQASISARLRDFRKLGHEVQRFWQGGGLFGYRLVVKRKEG